MIANLWSFLAKLSGVPQSSGSPRSVLLGSRDLARCGAGAILLLACGRSEAVSHSNPPPPLAQRGEHVVVEEGAGEFFEATVLGCTAKGLRVQRLDGTETEELSQSEVYRLGVPAAPLGEGPLGVGEVAICNLKPNRWGPCRVVRVTDQNIVVATLEADELELPRPQVLKPTELTALSLKRRFVRAEEKRDFLQALHRVGSPRAPASWQPATHQRVVALREQQWFSARVREVDDETLFIDWLDTGRPAEISRSQVIPEPPYDFVPRRGAFALVRPSAPSAPWSGVRIVNTVTEDSVRISDETGNKRTVAPRDLIPID